MGLGTSVPATCFPTASVLASSWDPALARAEGVALGEECRQQGVAVLLGPGVNIKRSPLCGRNFEYFSEDPLLAGSIGAGWVEGVQSQGVGVSLKHYAANSQETNRMVSNSVVDPQALQEVYLAPFAQIVRQAKPQTVMCAYNRVNGLYACENPELLTKQLRETWGFDGIVMSDWGATDERVASLRAGLDLEMPGPAQENDRAIVDAVRSGELDMSILDARVQKLLELLLRHEPKEPVPCDMQAHHALAADIAAASTVLLKNEGNLLPLAQDEDLAVIGAFAETPRYQGSGSSRIVPTQLDNLLCSLTKAGRSVPYAPGYSLDPDASPEIQEALCQEAVDLAGKHAAAVVCVGLPDIYESEGYDRTSLSLPPEHDRLVERICAVCSRVVVVLMCGSAVLLPWEKQAQAILMPGLAGQASGLALAQILFGQTEPSGRLAETFPLRLEDTPSFRCFGGTEKNVEYREGILVGYGYYDWAGKAVRYPFGHGLGYTSFALDDLRVEWDEAAQCVSASVHLCNTGSRAGAQVVQMYVGKPDSVRMRIPHRLVAFMKVRLNPGESTCVRLNVPRERLQTYLTEEGRWAVEDGEYQFWAGFSSRDLPLCVNMTIPGEALNAAYRYVPENTLMDGEFAPDRAQFERLYGQPLPLMPDTQFVDLNTPIKEILSTPQGKAMLGQRLEESMGVLGASSVMQNSFAAAPLRAAASFSGSYLPPNMAVSRHDLRRLIDAINAANME